VADSSGAPDRTVVACRAVGPDSERSPKIPANDDGERSLRLAPTDCAGNGCSISQLSDASCAAVVLGAADHEHPAERCSAQRSVISGNSVEAADSFEKFLAERPSQRAGPGPDSNIGPVRSPFTPVTFRRPGDLAANGCPDTVRFAMKECVRATGLPPSARLSP
jgi:hypothetical protein